MCNKIRVAYITKNLRVNGISSVILNYCENLDKDFFEITIFAGNPIDKTNQKKCEQHGIKIKKMPSKRGKNPLKYYSYLFKNLDSKKYDIVHIHGNSATIAIELLIAKIKKIKNRIAHCHSTSCDMKLAHFILKPLLKLLYTKGFSCSEQAGRWLFGNKEFEVLSNGFTTKKFIFNESIRKEKRKELGIENKFVIGHVGLFVDSKNHPFILDVFKEVSDIRSDAVLLLVGAGPNFDIIQSLINKHQYKDRIICYGETSEVDKMYDCMDAFIFPSKYEGFGIVLLEAQIKGLKCVASNNVPKEVALNNNSIKFLSLDDNKNLWRDALINSENLKNRADFYRHNLETITKYDIKENVQNLESVYKKLLKYKIR